MSAGVRVATTEVVGSYRDRDGRVRQVIVGSPAPGHHRVLELSEDGEPRMIEELCGEGESPATAAAVARDYLQQQRRAAAG
jgi:hypothetical protein